MCQHDMYIPIGTCMNLEALRLSSPSLFSMTSASPVHYGRPQYVILGLLGSQDLQRVRSNVDGYVVLETMP